MNMSKLAYWKRVINKPRILLVDLRAEYRLNKMIKDGLPYLFHSFTNKYFNKISLGNMLYFQNKL